LCLRGGIGGNPVGAVEYLKTLCWLGLKPATSFRLSGKNCGG
jgi:hypothetical protein